MKNQLLTTSALVAAGLIGMSGTAVAQKSMGPTVTVSGFANGYIGYADNKDIETGGTKYNATNVKLDSEIHFDARSMTDNGLVLRAHLELEGPGDGRDVWDEAYVRVDGSFGGLRVGSEDSSTQLMVTGYYGIWATAAGTQYDVEVGSWLPNPAGFTGDVTPATATGDEDRATYITPRMQGFQLGVSFAPDMTNSRGGTGSNSEENKTIATKAAANKDLVSVSGNFDQKFGDTRVGIAAGYETWSQATAGPKAQFFSIGASVENGPFKLAAGYSNRNDMQAAGSATSSDGDVFQVGGRYTMGPNAFSVGVHYSSLQGAVATSGDDKETGVLASYARTLGPGAKVSLNGIYADRDNEGAGADAQGFALLGVLHLRF